MRILYHHRTLGDGAEGIHIVSIVDALRRLGHEVELSGPAITANDARKPRSVISSVRRAMPAAAFEAAQLATSGLTYFSARRSIETFKPAFIYKRHAKYDYGTVLAARHANVPLILEVNCVYSAPSLRAYESVSFTTALTRTERWIFEHADTNITVSTPLMGELHTVAPSAHAVVMSNGVDHRRFVHDPARREHVRRQLGIDDDQMVVGFVGTLWNWHGLDLLIQAFAQLAGRIDTRLLIVGDGEMRTRLTEMCREHGIANRAIFPGRQPHDEIAGYVAAMDITVLPAEHRSHASPMKVIEYMASGKPVVAPRLPNIQEIVDDGVEGLLFDQNSVEALASCLQRLIMDADLRDRLGRAGRQKVEHEFNWDMNARKVIDLYNAICSDRRRLP